MSDADPVECVRCGSPILHEPMPEPDVCESCWWEQELIVSDAVRVYLGDTTGGNA
jgi:hypothetical protein